VFIGMHVVKLRIPHVNDVIACSNCNRVSRLLHFAAFTHCECWWNQLVLLH